MKRTILLLLVVIFAKTAGVDRIEFTLPEQEQCLVIFDKDHYYDYVFTASNWTILRDGTIYHGPVPFQCVEGVRIE